MHALSVHCALIKIDSGNGEVGHDQVRHRVNLSDVTIAE
jgi:hypothetical protein